jgi:NNP family nitrate/nitrite transporter-like MFS transporter
VDPVPAPLRAGARSLSRLQETTEPVCGPPPLCAGDAPSIISGHELHFDTARLVHRAPAARDAARVSEATRNLVLATAAFTACFYAWSIIGPLSPALQKALALSELQTAAMVAVPVLLGSLLRVPLGLLSDIYGGRRVFTVLMSFSILPAVALAAWHDSLASMIALGFLLGIAGASFAVGVVFVNGWYASERRGFALGVYGMGMGGTVLAALSAPRISDAYGLRAPFVVAAVLLLITTVVFATLARDASAPQPRTGPLRLLAPLAVFRTSARAWALTLFYFLSFGGFVAMFLYLPKLLTGVYDLSKTDAGARAAGFALLAVLARPAGGWLAGEVGAVTGVVGAAGGLGGFFPPLVMGVAMSVTGSYTIGFLLLAAVAAGALVVATKITNPQPS